MRSRSNSRVDASEARPLLGTVALGLENRCGIQGWQSDTSAQPLRDTVRTPIVRGERGWPVPEALPELPEVCDTEPHIDLGFE